jgi:hypothetical protein
MKKKTRIVIAGLSVTLTVAAVALTGFAGYIPGRPFWLGNSQPQSQTLALLGVLEGFQPGAKVSYSVLPEKGTPASGEIKVGEDGKIKLPGFNMRNAAGRYLSYNMQIDEGGKPLDVALTFDAKEGNIAVDGKGLSQFGNIEFSGKDTVEAVTRADWAGIIKNPTAGKLNDLGLDGFKVAMFDNIQNDATQKPNPKIIKVLAAPGGGLWVPPSGADPQLNQYIEDFYACDDGESPTVEYSFCDDSPMQDQIDLIVENYVTALYMMGEQLTAVMGFMMLPVGALIDAKIQLEAQRDMQALVAEAHKDYHPSQMMCEFGSYMKSITTAEEKAVYEKLALNDILLNFYTGLFGVSSSESFQSDVDSRVQQFRTTYCDPYDNNNGLRFMCDHDQVGAGTAVGAPAAQRTRINKDIDYRRTMDSALTLDLDLAYAHTGGNNRAQTADEEDVIALAKNLYWPRVMPAGNPKMLNDNFASYLNVRQLYALTNVAHNSYVTLAGQKSKTEPALGANSGWSYMKAMMRDTGLTDAEIHQYLGDFPSYYAQMEVLTKKIYQQPDFYTNLYDKPANVKRISNTLEAIQIMQDRDFYESALRREMLTSAMVEAELRKHVERLNASVVSDVKDLQRQ